MDEDRNLPPDTVTDAWLAELIRCMRRDPSYRPTIAEIRALRDALSSERGRRTAERQAGRKPTPLPRRPWGRAAEPTPGEIVAELVGSIEFQAVAAAAWGAIDAAGVALVAAANTRRRGPR